MTIRRRALREKGDKIGNVSGIGRGDETIKRCRNRIGEEGMKEERTR